ncbi:hypothetical protein ACFY7H_13040 [Streptomyces sp. NPDC012794]|uniref:DUF6197 family protein n=1 Tax=Streptomyces sp. NPDC012794 TaxID=3364850 RepID=UPI0036B71FED
MTATCAAAAPTRAAAPTLTIDDRLALSHLAMDERLASGGVSIAVTLAGHPIPDVDLGAPIIPAWRPTHTSPVAQVLETAGHLIAEAGWSRRWLRETGGAMCLLGAIRTAAGGEGPLADGAADVLLGQIRAEQPEVQSVAAWNEAQTNQTPVLGLLDRAARHADKNGI